MRHGRSQPIGCYLEQLHTCVNDCEPRLVLENAETNVTFSKSGTASKIIFAEVNWLGNEAYQSTSLNSSDAINYRQ
jgi:hypothetical protein